MTATPLRDPLGLLEGGESVIVGTVVCGATIAAGVGHTSSIGQLAAAIAAAVVVYYLAHVHAAVLGSAVSRGHHPRDTLRRALRHSLPMLFASLLPLAALLVAALAGAEVRSAATVALVATTGLLVAYSWLAASRRDLGPWDRLASAAVGGGLGLLLVLVKSLH